jgi:enoyl-CoA hydratase/carnithine racemase
LAKGDNKIVGLLEYKMDDHVAILTMTEGENRFNKEFFAEMDRILDDIENETEAKILVVASAHEKIWCNGIDLNWLMPLSKNDPEEAKKFPYKLTGLFKRFLYFPMITVAAINGHAFAGGAILASAMDFRFMKNERGYFCIPEVDIKIPLSPSMIGIMRKAVPKYKFLEMQYLGIRLTAEDCEKHNVITKACGGDTLMEEVLTFAKAHKKDREVISSMKELTYLVSPSKK